MGRARAKSRGKKQSNVAKMFRKESIKKKERESIKLEQWPKVY